MADVYEAPEFGAGAEWGTYVESRWPTAYKLHPSAGAAKCSLTMNVTAHWSSGPQETVCASALYHLSDGRWQVVEFFPQGSVLPWRATT